MGSPEGPYRRTEHKDSNGNPWWNVEGPSSLMRCFYGAEEKDAIRLVGDLNRAYLAGFAKGVEVAETREPTC